MPKNTTNYNRDLQQMMENIRKMVEASIKRKLNFKVEPVEEVPTFEDIPVQQDSTMLDNRVSWLNKPRTRTNGGFVTDIKNGTNIWENGGQLN